MEIQEIQKALGALKKEVSDLHPHLGAFLGKLPNVVDVKHTHGATEYGADFILTEKHDVEGTNYIGVVAKIGNITKKDESTVSSQIKECFNVSRPVDDGKHKSRIDKVWVIFTGNMSNNVREVLCSEPRPGVTFIDGLRLAQLMCEYKYVFNSDISSSVSVCLLKQENIAKNLKNQSVGLIPSAIYIDQKVIKLEHSQYRSKTLRTKRTKREKTSIENAIKNNQYLLIYGDAGAGKSKMLYNILSHYARQDVYKKTQAIPIFASCKKIEDNHGGKISNLITSFREEHKLTDDKKSSYVIIVDDIDEMAISRDERVEYIKKLRKDAFQQNEMTVHQLVFASRDYFEDKSIDIPIYKIAPLSGKEIVSVIKENLSHLNTVHRIIQDVSKSEIFKSLQENPLATVILISLLKDKRSNQELPGNLTELFLKYTECSLGRWDENVPETTKQQRYEASRKILSNIAKYMIDNGCSQLNAEQAKSFFSKYLNSRRLNVSAKDLFNYVVEESNLLYLDENEKIFRFRHRVICEFFYALQFSEEYIDHHEEHIFDIKWNNILFFYVGIQKDCSSLLKKISGIKPRHESGVIMKSVNMSNILLAGYASSYDSINGVLKDVFIDAAEYLEGVINRKIESPRLSELPIMHLLFIFRVMMDYEYSRNFFKESIDQNMLDIHDINMPDNIKATALFLLNMPYRTLGGGNIFEDLIDSIGRNRIPIHIQLAIKHESDFMEEEITGAKLRKFSKYMNRKLHNAGNEITSLYDKSIKSIGEIKKLEKK